VKENKLGNDGSSLGDQSNKIGMNLVVDLPRWLEEAVQQKNPRVSLALAYSLLLEYDELDKELLLMTSLN
jgi:hypothetical protein